MKKYFSLFIILLAFNCFSQKTGNFILDRIRLPLPSPEFINPICDSSCNVNFSTDTAVVYTNTGTGNWGYVSGTNSYKDISKAEKFFTGTYTNGYQLLGGIFYFAKAKDGGDSSQMSIAVWADDGLGGYPKTKIASESFYVSDITPDTLYTSLMFSQPVPVQGNFYFGLDGFIYDSPQSDTVVVYTSTKNVVTNTAYEQWIDSTWHSFDEPNNWNFKSKFFIAAFLCNTDVGKYEIINHSDEPVIFPNPTTEKVYIDFGTEVIGEVSIQIYDINGKCCYQSLLMDSKQTEIDIKNFSSGVYSIKINTLKGSFTHKIVIQ